MKKTILILLLGLMPFGLFAQGFFSFGPKVGWNSDKLTTHFADYVKDFKSGFQAGLFCSLKVKRVYLQPEVYFSIKRGALQTSFWDPLNQGTKLSVSQSVSLKTVDVPILLGFKLLDLEAVRLRLWGGPVASYLLNKEYTLSINGENHSDVITEADFKNAVWSAQLGVGLDVLMLTFDVGYDFGLSHFANLRNLYDLDLSNNMFFCSIGWRIF